MNSAVSTKRTPASQARISGVNASTGSSLAALLAQAPTRARIRVRQTKQVERAVYAYLQAMRSLKRTRVTPEDVAAALGISVASALTALTALQSRGVKRFK